MQTLHQKLFLVILNPLQTLLVRNDSPNDAKYMQNLLRFMCIDDFEMDMEHCGVVTDCDAHCSHQISKLHLQWSVSELKLPNLQMDIYICLEVKAKTEFARIR